MKRTNIIIANWTLSNVHFVHYYFNRRPFMIRIGQRCADTLFVWSIADLGAYTHLPRTFCGYGLILSDKLFLFLLLCHSTVFTVWVYVIVFEDFNTFYHYYQRHWHTYIFLLGHLPQFIIYIYIYKHLIATLTTSMSWFLKFLFVYTIWIIC